VLVVDDGETNRKLIQFVLGRAGAIVFQAENGQQAVDRVMAEPFDLILMDMQMPVMDGHQATAELRRHGVTVPILALTANSMKGDEERCLAAGCSGFLSKPIDGDRLLRGVGEALRAAARALHDRTTATPPRESTPAKNEPSSPCAPSESVSLPDFQEPALNW
jgi:CheY-like chemotaxis protein